MKIKVIEQKAKGHPEAVCYSIQKGTKFTKVHLKDLFGSNHWYCEFLEKAIRIQTPNGDNFYYDQAGNPVSEEEFNSVWELQGGIMYVPKEAPVDFSNLLTK